MAKQAKAKASNSNEPKRGRGRPKKEKPDTTNLPDPNQVAACFAEIQSIDIDALRVRARREATLKRYERSHGVDPDSVKRMVAEAKKDPGEVSRKIRLDREYRRMVGLTRMSKSGQVEMAMDVLVAEGPVPTPDSQARVAVAMAHMDGYNSALAGGNIENNPHDPGTEQHVKWIEGFRDGEADRLLKNPDAANVKEASTRRTRREPTPPDPEKVQELAKDITRELAETEATGAVH